MQDRMGAEGRAATAEPDCSPSPRPARPAVRRNCRRHGGGWRLIVSSRAGPRRSPFSEYSYGTPTATLPLSPRFLPGFRQTQLDQLTRVVRPLLRPVADLAAAAIYARRQAARQDVPAEVTVIRRRSRQSVRVAGQELV